MRIAISAISGRRASTRCRAGRSSRAARTSGPATQFLYFAGTPAIEARLVAQFGEGGLAKGANDGLPADLAQVSPTTPANLAAAVRVDTTFWRDNLTKLHQQLRQLVDALTEAARLSIEQREGRVVMVFAGRLDVASIGALWRPAMQAAEHARGQKLAFDLGAVSFSDVGGASFLAAVEAAHGDAARADRRAGARAGTAASRACSVAGGAGGDTAPRASARDVIAMAFGLAAAGVGFVGEAAVAFVRLPWRRRMLRVPDLLRYIDQAGVRSLPLLLLLGYLIGLILAFQSAIPMRRFGADIFVANLVALSLIRELGPLLAAVILAGRTGSAFAAEIGTMKVNEEVDALVTMGLDPMTMLVLPRHHGGDAGDAGHDADARHRRTC